MINRVSNLTIFKACRHYSGEIRKHNNHCMVILDLSLRKSLTGKSHDNVDDHRFRNVFRPN